MKADATDREPVRIRLTALELTVCVGVPEWERRRPQHLSADIEVVCDAAVVEADDVGRSVDYAALADFVRRRSSGVCVQLLETLAGMLCKDIISSFPVAEEVRIRLAKPAVIPHCEAASVEVLVSRAGREPAQD